MSIKDLIEKIKGPGHFQAPELPTIKNDLFLGLIIVLVAVGSFGLGRLSKIEGTKTPIRIENEPIVTDATFSHSSQRTSSETASVLESTQGSNKLLASKS